MVFSKMKNPKIQMDSKQNVHFVILQILQERVKDEKLYSWVKHLLELAGHGIEIGGLPFKQAIADFNEYEPIDVYLASMVNELANTVQDTLVQRALFRRDGPKMIDLIVKDSLLILSSLSTEATIPCHENDETPYVQTQLDISNYKSVIADASKILEVLHLMKDLPKVLTKARETEKLLTDLKIPFKAPKNLSVSKKRRSSMLTQLVHYQEQSPKRAAYGLLSRLESEAKKQI
jgi:hypothetical protein